MTKPMLTQRDENGRSWLTQMADYLDVTKPVQVYRNLHKDCWSVRQGNKVRCHTPYVALEDCTFPVSEKTRQRVITEKKKYVHAMVKGTPCDPMKIPHQPDLSLPTLAHPISYNPYKLGYFYWVKNETEIKSAAFVDMMMNEDNPVLAWEAK